MMFTIYGKPNCPYCTRAKDTLDSKGIDYTYLTLDEDFTVPDLIDLVIAKTGVRPSTFPQIFVQEDGETDTTHVGGFTELVDFLK